VVGRGGVGIITRDHFVCECGQVDCERGIGDSISGLLEGGIAENGTGGWECRTRDYN
jgi:hypothetical protein